MRSTSPPPTTFDVMPNHNPYFAPGTLTTHHWMSAAAALSAGDTTRQHCALATMNDDDESDDDPSSVHSDTDSESGVTLQPSGAMRTVPSMVRMVDSANNLLARPYLTRAISGTAMSPPTPNASTVFDSYDSRLHVHSPSPNRTLSGTEPNFQPPVTDANGQQLVNWNWSDAPIVHTPGELQSGDLFGPTADGKWDPSSSPSFPTSNSVGRNRSPGGVGGHPAHSHAHFEHNVSSHFRGLSMLDEDDQLATHLDATALDALEDAGEEEEEDRRSERQRRRTTSLVRTEDAETAKDTKATDSDPKTAGQSSDASNADKPGPVRGDTDLTVRSASTVDDDDAAFLAAVNVRLDPAAKLRALREEFGPSRVRYSSKPQDKDVDAGEEDEEEEETFVGSSMAVLFRTVLIRGTLVVTNHRLCFFAILPPPLGTPAQSTPGRSLTSGSGSNEAGAGSGNPAFAGGAQAAGPSTPGIPTDPALSNPIIIKGPAVLHRTGWRRKRRCWFELRADGFCAYPSSEDLYQPLGSIRLQDIEEICPADFKRVTWLSVKVVGGKTASLEFNTEEACQAWRREAEAALWAYRNSSDKIRISIPLARIAGVEKIGMLHFAIASTVRVFEHEPGTGTISNGKTRDVSFGITKRNAGLIDQLHTQLQGPTKWREELGFDEAMRRTPVPIIEVEGSRVQDEHDVDSGDEGDKRADKSSTSGGSADAPLKAAAESAATVAGTPMEKAQSKNSVKSASGVGSSDSSHAKQPSETPEEAAARAKQITRAQRFIDQFVLKARPEELTLYKADIVRTIPSAGTLAVSTHFLCFWRRRLGSLPDIRLKIPVSDLVGASTSRAFRWHVWGLSLHIRGHADLMFEFHDQSLRDRVLEQIQMLIQTLENEKEKEKQSKNEGEKGSDSAGDGGDTTSRRASEAPASHLAVSETAGDSSLERHPHRQDSEMARQAIALMETGPDEEIRVDPRVINALPKMINLPGELQKVPPMNIFCLTIGSRGDVQPYISLGKALQKHGHRVTIVSHPEYEDWVRGHGIDYRPVGGDPGKLMQLSVEHRILSPSFFRESIGKFRDWLDELLRESWEQCQGADLLIESPSTMSGIHVAEGLGIPYFRAFTMPWTPTSAYPQAFSVPPFEMGPSYNALSYTLFDSIMWRATSGQINRWRKHMIGLKATDSTELEVNKVPFIYNFSEAVVPFPNDWGSRISISGYWFLDTGAGEWDPPEDLVAFLDKAKEDGKKIAYIGFGSITVPDPVGLTKAIYAAVKAADVRAIVSKGWSARMQKGKAKEEEPIPAECFVVDSIPHDWLFPRIDIAMHHGGAGTTGASLRAGLVTLIKPFFGDQYMWALRVQKLGAGARVGGLDSHDISDALKKAAEDRVMVEKAQEVGRKIRSENGPNTAIAFIYQNLNIAKRTRHDRVPTKSWTASLIRTDTAASASGTGAQSEHEDVLSDDGAPSSQRRRSCKPVKSPFSTGSSERQVRESASTTSSSTKTNAPLSTPSTGLSTPSQDLATFSESETEGDRPAGHAPPKKTSSAFAKLQTLPSISMPSMPNLPIPNVIKDLVGTDAAKSPNKAGDATDLTKAADETSGIKSASSPAMKTEEAPKKPATRSYKGLKAEDRRRGELMAERYQREIDNGATPFEAAQRQAKQAAADSAERIRLADEEAEKEAAKEKEEKERKARTKTSHVLPSFVTNSGRKSIDISGLWPSATSGIGASSHPPSSANANTAVSETESGSASSKEGTQRTSTGSDSSATLATAGTASPSSTAAGKAGEQEVGGRPVSLERRATDGIKPNRRTSIRDALRGCRSPPSSSSAKTSLDVKRDTTVVPVAHSAPPTAAPPTPAADDGLKAMIPPATGDSGNTLRPSEGPGTVQPIESDKGVGNVGKTGAGPLGEPLTTVQSPLPMNP
ncbi:hypothetical protein CF327_g5378 [Tilletia walkeri]|nr:hypothetical protein CF327_g5378 [Tilletia walkeri]